jgi:hypothetical protein
MIRKFIVNRLYDLADLICLAADRFSPEDDSVWRERMWETYKERIEAEELAEWPEPRVPPLIDMPPGLSVLDLDTGEVTHRPVYVRWADQFTYGEDDDE